MSLVLAYGRSNFFSGTHKFIIFRMLGWLQYMEIISLTVISSWDASEKFPSDRGFRQNILLLYLITCSLHIELLLFSISMKSLEIQPLLVKKGLTVRQNFLLVIIPSFVDPLKKFFFPILVRELHLSSVLL